MIDIVAVVRPNPDSTYSLAIARKDDVPEFGPPIAYSKYDRSPAFIDFLLCKRTRNGKDRERKGKGGRKGR